MPISANPCARAAHLNALLPTIYNRMHHMAQHLLLHSKWFQHIEAHELVHETYLKLYHYAPSHEVNDQQHLLALSVRMMRQVLVDYVRKQSTQKRGGSWERVDMDYLTTTALTPDASTLVDFDVALTRLHYFDARMAQVVEYRFYGNMKMEEIGVALDLSERTVARLWRRARAYLYMLLADEDMVV